MVPRRGLLGARLLDEQVVVVQPHALALHQPRCDDGQRRVEYHLAIAGHAMPVAEVLEEAAQMAVCWSRAWASGGRSATAFHASYGQVSKTTESGESLGRGSFVVRGNRHWYKDIRMEMSLGMIAINGVPLPLVGTHSVISQFCERWIRLTPGTQKKELVATKIARATGLLQDDILSALPPGNLTIGENQGILDAP